ncbi:MAG: hypothetical protein ACYCVZ_10790, partial [Streptosporangiaceae bacterium]
MGTSNFGSWFGDSAATFGYADYGNARHDGSWWAGAVGKAEQDIVAQNAGYQVSIFGGIDAELAWNGPDPTEDWAADYDNS